MKRRLVTIPSALSLLLCAATTVLWIRSERSLDVCGNWRWGNFAGLMSTQGAVLSIRGGNNNPNESGWFFHAGPKDVHGWTYLHLANSSSPMRWRPGIVAPTILGIDGMEFGIDGVAVPYWMLFTTFLSLPLIDVGWRYFLYALTMRRRARLGLCPTCGYDLRASKDRCPECGTAVRSASVHA